MQKVPLILVNNALHYPKDDEPRQDYIEIARSMNGDLRGYNLSDAAWYQQVRQVETRFKLDFVEALSASRQAEQYNSIVSLSEKIGIPMAMIQRAKGGTTPHVLIAHKLSSGLKTRLFSIMKMRQLFDSLICVSQAQADFAIEHLGFESDKVHFVYDKVDHRFFYPQRVDPGDFILAVGQEQRDYATLLQAISGTGIGLIVVASSPWSTSQINLRDVDTTVRVRHHIPYTELRDLYAHARLVVLPLYAVDYAAGANGLLEAMSMGKAIIVSRTPGLKEYVADEETCSLTTPGDISELRDSILARWDDHVTCTRLGMNARQVVEDSMNLDIYVQAITEIVAKTLR